MRERVTRFHKKEAVELVAKDFLRIVKTRKSK